jgi:hypothetical protein
MNRRIESAMFLIGFGLLLLAINFVMLRPTTKEFYSNPKLIDSLPASSFELIAFYYISLISSIMLLFFGVLEIIHFFKNRQK